MNKTTFRLAIAAVALTSGIAVGLPAPASAAPATTTPASISTISVTADDGAGLTGGDWGRHRRFHRGFGRFGFPFFGGFPFGFNGFGGFGFDNFGFGGFGCVLIGGLEYCPVG